MHTVTHKISCRYVLAHRDRPFDLVPSHTLTHIYRTTPKRTEQTEASENAAATAATADDDAAPNIPAANITGPKTHSSRKKQTVISTLTSLKEDPEEDAVANSTEDLETIARLAASNISGAERPKIDRSESFSTSQNDDAEPDVECESISSICFFITIVIYLTMLLPFFTQNTLRLTVIMIFFHGVDATPRRIFVLYGIFGLLECLLTCIALLNDSDLGSRPFG